MHNTHQYWLCGIVTLLCYAFVRDLFEPLAVLAQPALPSTQIPVDSYGSLCGATGLCNNSPTTGFASIVDFALSIAIPAGRTLMIGVSVVYFAWYGATLLFQGIGGGENAMTESKKAFGYAALGMGIVGVASLLVDTFAPSEVGANLVNEAPFTDGVQRAVRYIFLVTGAFLVFTISTSGFRIIALQGSEGETEKLRKNFFNGLLGVVLLLMANTIVIAVVPPSAGGAGPSTLIQEAGGIIRFLLEIVAGLSVVAIIAAGLFYIFSLGTDERKQRAQRILTSTIVILLIVMSSHMLVSTFIR